MQKLYEEGSDRIESELNIVKFMKKIRYLNILMKNSLMTRERKFEITHSEKNFINIDLSDEGGSE